jgi:hypothetical protein
METRHDLRRQERQLCGHDVTVIWRDATGDSKFAIAKVVDICETGIRIQMPEAPPLHTYVTIRAKKLGLLGDASIRYCARTTASKFAVGAEFTGGLRWNAAKDAV